jgi:hypothetical protein
MKIYKSSYIFFIILYISCNTTKHDLKTNFEDLKIELKQINDLDQKFAGIPPKEMLEKFGFEKTNEIFQKQKDSVKRLQQKRIKEIYGQHGFLGFDKVGKEGSGSFWIVIQHADNDLEFQKKMLSAMKNELKKNNIKKSNFALLEDRVAVNSNKKQRFGTQVTYNKIGQAIPKNGLLDTLKVNMLRKEFELPDIIEYYNMMIKDNFEMNKKSMEMKGILTPNLYVKK